MVLEKIFGSQQGTDGLPIGVVWEVMYDVDDHDGPGWYVGSGRINRDEGGPFEAKDEALQFASERAKVGDVFEIWDRDEPDRPRLMYYNPTFDAANEYDLVASR